MFAKVLCATAIMAMGSFMFIDTADAQRRGGAERGGNSAAEAGPRRGRGGVQRPRGSQTAGRTRTPRANRPTRAAQPRANRPTRAAQPRANRPTRAARPRANRPTRAAQPRANRPTRAARPRANRPTRAARPRANRPIRAARPHAHHPRNRWSARQPFAWRWHQARRWANRRLAAYPYFNDRGCTAVARRDDGNGRIIQDVYGEGFGRRACRKALNRCEDELSYSQADGRNPYAACVVAWQ